MPLLVSCAETTLKKAPEVATTPFTASKAVKAVEALESALLTEEVKKILIAALSCQQPSSVGATFLTLNTSKILVTFSAPLTTQQVNRSLPECRAALAKFEKLIRNTDENTNSFSTNSVTLNVVRRNSDARLGIQFDDKFIRL